MQNSREKGSTTERIAKKYLINKGFRHVKSNVYFKTGEIDLIMRDNDFLVFVEVKSVTKESEYSIYETLTKSKKIRIRKAINNYLLKHNKIGCVWRVDFIGIIYSKGAVKTIEHFEFISVQ